MDLPALVVPIYNDANISSAFPFGCEGVVFFKRCLGVEGMFFADILDSEIINYQCELQWAPFMQPKREKVSELGGKDDI